MCSVITAVTTNVFAMQAGDLTQDFKTGYLMGLPRRTNNALVYDCMQALPC